MADLEAVLDAGGLLAIKTKVGGSDADEVSARSYQHVALADPVVRLTPDNLAQGDDLEMEFLGFEAPRVEGPLARQRRRALGFPGWALIHDPQHARYALEIVKQFKKDVRRARSKPGHAYDGFVAIAKQLGRSVAHFLPSFWEQVGREFMILGNNSYASRAFGKAREAERVHALKVNENLRGDAFLEFALGGCLSIKSLTDYGKDLQTSHKPLAAWKFFRELCVRRTMGGMPPWASMAKELNRLLKATDLDVKAETMAILAEILDSPAMSRAAAGFWKSYSKEIHELADRSDRIAGVLLNLIPETSDWDNDYYWEWLDHLDDWGLLENLWKPKVSKQAGPNGGPSAWFSRMVKLETAMRPRAFELLRKMAKVLKADPNPVQLGKEQRWGEDVVIDLDLLDLALELGVSVADPTSETRFDLGEWAAPEGKPVDRPRDVMYVAADPRFAEKLASAVAPVAGEDEFEESAAGKKSLAAAREAWLMGLIRDLSGAALPNADVAVNSIQNQTTRETFREFPAAYAALKKARLDKPLARTFRAGVLDELGWPIAEQTVARLDPDNKNRLLFYGGSPFLIITDGLQVVVVDHEKVVYEHELQLPKKAKLADLWFYDGHLSVHYEDSRYSNFFYWSDNPKKKLDEDWRSKGDARGFVVPLKSGTFNGTRTVHAGDTKPPDGACPFFTDGEHYWREHWDDGDRFLREINPSNGDTGRKSMPRFLEEFVAAGSEIQLEQCQLMKLGEQAVNSALGCRDGMVGWRARSTKSGQDVECEGIDGRSWQGFLVRDSNRSIPSGMLRLPGSTGLPMVDGGWRSHGELWDPSGSYRVATLDEQGSDYARGQAAALPVEFWHLLRVRNELVSKQLRQFSDAEAASLLEVVVAELNAAADRDKVMADELTKTSAAVEEMFPEATAGLFSGLAGIVFKAGAIAQLLDELTEERDPAGEDEVITDDSLGPLVGPAFEALGVGDAYGDGKRMFPHLSAVASFFIDGKKPRKLPPAPFGWFDIYDCLEARMWTAYWEKKTEGDDWLSVIDGWADLPLQDLPGGLRRVSGKFDDDAPFFRDFDQDDDDEEWCWTESNGNRYLMFREAWSDDWSILEYAADDEFHVPDLFEIEWEQVLERQSDAAHIKMLAEGMRNNEPPMLAEEARQEVADQLGLSFAEVGLIWCGFPHFNTWTKNFLPKPLREELGLKVSEAYAAHQSLSALDDTVRRRLVSRFLAGPTDALWEEDDQRAAERLMGAWTNVVPQRIALPAEFVDDFKDMLGHACELGTVLEALGDPHHHPAMQSRATWDFRIDDWNRPVLEPSLEVTFDGGMMRAVVASLIAFQHELPIGDPARQSVAEAYDAALRCLDSQDLLVTLGQARFWGDDVDAKANLENLVGKLTENKKTNVWSFEKGPVVARAFENAYTIAFRPAKAKTAKAVEKLRSLWVATNDDSSWNHFFEPFDFLRSGRLRLIRNRLTKTPVPDGSYEACPWLSAPDLVSEVAAATSLSESAAALYLQTLALPDPTTRNVKRWNGWSTAQYNKAARELTEAGHVLKAKRSRAGRNFFLPGGWEALKNPHLPTESWKLPLWGITRDQQSGQLNIPLERIYCLDPIHDVFAKAWQRVVEGDEPKYEEVS